MFTRSDLKGISGSLKSTFTKATGVIAATIFTPAAIGLGLDVMGATPHPMFGFGMGALVGTFLQAPVCCGVGGMAPTAPGRPAIGRFPTDAEMLTGYWGGLSVAGAAAWVAHPLPV